MTKHFFSLLLIVFQLSNLCSASEVKTYKGVIDGGYNFFVATPTSKSDTLSKPLIVFLHGASLCGTNLERVRRYGVLNAVERGLKIPAIVVAPQNPGGAWRPSKVNDVVEWVEHNYSVDTARVYVMGMSLGGYGTLDFANAYPEKVAAAVALCGGSSVRHPSGLGKVPLWVMHGTA
ncbi:MAG: prolyl oligopeptidase family serine peptidase, partial [Paludibacteraceae bacterium]|nr:prolyl oligopeptidase family serine peptidase [Paludibacteraceae bacterium]